MVFRWGEHATDFHNIRDLRKETTPKEKSGASQGTSAPLTTAAPKRTAFLAWQRGLRLSRNSCMPWLPCLGLQRATQPAVLNTGHDEYMRRAETCSRPWAGKVLAAEHSAAERAPAGTHSTRGSADASPVLTARSCTSFSSKEYSSVSIQSLW